MVQVFVFLPVFLVLSLSVSQNLEPYAKEIGGTFCKYLAFKSQIPRKYFNECPQPTCNWDDWNHALSNANTSIHHKKRVVISYAHNGFGNQLWEHSVAFMIAESLKAQLLIAVIPDEMSPGGVIPPNTWNGMGAMSRLLPNQFLYENLPADSEIRALCDNEHFVVADRPVDWRDKNYTAHFKSNLLNILTDKNPRCLKFVGYFQNLPLCADDARRLWTTSLIANFTMKPGDNDISIYLRCVPRHYHFNDKNFYESILNHTTYDRIWLFQAPECPRKLGDDPEKDGVVAAVVRLLKEKYHATVWPSFNGTDDVSFLLHDLSGLTQSKKLILPVSSWAYWAGLLSNATEIHVNAPPHHSVMYGMPQYIYHDDKHKKYFGRYNATENDIIYEIDPPSGRTKTPHSRGIPYHSGGAAVLNSTLAGNGGNKTSNHHVNNKQITKHTAANIPQDIDVHSTNTTTTTSTSGKTAKHRHNNGHHNSKTSSSTDRGGTSTTEEGESKDDIIAKLKAQIEALRKGDGSSNVDKL